MDYQLLIERCNVLIREGQDARVVSQLNQIDLKAIPNRYRLSLANLSRRVSKIYLGLKILTPLIHPKGAKRSEASAAEKAEHSALLQRCGAVDEALKTLKQLDPLATPLVDLYTAFCHFNRWEYRDAIPFLERYKTSVQDPYQLLVVNVNLGAAQIANRDFDGASELLQQTLEKVREKNHRRLQANCRELLAQIAIARDDLSLAQTHLQEIEALLDSGRSVDRLLAEKCSVFTHSKRLGNIEQLKLFREKALNWPHAETVREIDLFTLQIQFDGPLLERLYFGTPYPAYRQRIKETIGRVPASDDFYSGERRLSVFDIEDGTFAEKTVFKRGSLPHRVVQAILKDHYRPLRTAALFNSLFPDEYFDVQSSPLRVHQLVKRTKGLLRENSVDLEILSSREGYRFQIGNNVSVRFRTENKSKEEDAVARLRAGSTNDDGYSFQQMLSILQMTESQLRRFIAAKLRENVLERYGAGQSTRYFVRNSV